MHVTAEECARQGATMYRPYLNGVDMTDALVIEAEDGPRGFLILDRAGFAAPVPLDAPDWLLNPDESTPGPALVLFGHVTLEPIP